LGHVLSRCHDDQLERGHPLQRGSDATPEEERRGDEDLDVPDLDAAVSRVQELGGNKLRELNEYGIKWAVMADPDDNEFCLVQHSK
jgi:predicted enzyme related to lactoylglutathione lyase